MEVPKAAPLMQAAPFMESDKIIWSMQANEAPAYQPDTVIESGSPLSDGRVVSVPFVSVAMLAARR